MYVVVAAHLPNTKNTNPINTHTSTALRVPSVMFQSSVCGRVDARSTDVATDCVGQLLHIIDTHLHLVGEVGERNPRGHLLDVAGRLTGRAAHVEDRSGESPIASRRPF